MKWVLLLFFSVAPAYALDLRDLSIHYQYFDASNRIPDLDGMRAKEGLALDMDLDLFWRTYWDVRIVSLTDGGGYKLIGLNFHLGVRVLDNLSVEYEHFSKHLLDHPDSGLPFGKFPVYDSIGLVWTLYSNPVPSKGIF